MGDLIRLFAEDGGIVPFTKRGAEQQALIARQAREVKDSLPLWLTSEVYGVRPGYGQREDDIFPNPSEQEYGRDFYSRIVPKMRTNVLEYGAEQEKAKDVGEHLELSILAGIPGDTESEIARACVEAAIDANDEFPVSMRILAEQHEYGFRGGENIFGILNRGEAKNLIYPEAIIPHPPTWFSFNWKGECLFTPPDSNGAYRRLVRENPLVPEIKVIFGRSGALHTRYGHGTAADCYPTVYEIDIEYKKLRALTERHSDPPMVVTTPHKQGSRGFADLHAQVKAQHRNFIIITADTLDGGPVFKMNTDGTYAAANATGAVILQLIAKKVHAIATFLQGSVSTPSSETGSFAREVSIDTQKMYKAPTYAACKEAMLNRGFIRPIMLLNFPLLPAEKWPRASVDSRFGVDVRQELEVLGFLADRGVQISWATACDRTTKVPIAGPGDGPTLSASRSAAAPVVPNSVDESLKAFSEPMLGWRLDNGRFVQVPLDAGVLTEKDGVKRASAVIPGRDKVLAIQGVDQRLLRAV